MSLDVTLRYSKKVRDQLIWLKRQTGLPHFHTLCRWAFCISLSDPTPARLVQVGGDAEERKTGAQSSGGQSFELPWDRFGQREAGVLAELLRARATNEGLGTDRDSLQKLAQAHIQRGVSRMMVGKRIRSIADLVRMATSHEHRQSIEDQARPDRDSPN